jgi:hypothetical protein
LIFVAEKKIPPYRVYKLLLQLPGFARVGDPTYQHHIQTQPTKIQLKNKTKNKIPQQVLIKFIHALIPEMFEFPESE